MAAHEEIPLLDEKKAVECLAANDIVPTRQRVQIARMLLACKQHLSAEQVLEIADSAAIKVSKATVYNTLGLFARKGILRQVFIDPNRTFYDTNTSFHYHFYNQDTGKLSDIDQSRIPVDHLPEVPDGTTLDSVEVIIRVSSKPK